MSTRGYTTTRPVSMPIGQIQNNVQDDNENTYRAADGKILQSSMVKTGSPNKKRAVSQVRFSLPPPETDNSFEDDDEISIVQGFDDDSSDDFEKRTVFNQGSRELEAPIRGRKSSRNDISISDSMKQLVSTSPERNKLFIRGDSELNDQPLPIPVELKLPPLLSPNNQGKKRPSSLIYNGLDYEPFEYELASDPRYIKAKSLEFVKSPKSLPTPTASPTHLKEKISRSIQSPANNHTLNASKQIEIPDFNKPYQSPIKPKKSEIDNEKEIQNPSKAARKQNNQLNTRFSFPAGPQTDVSQRTEDNVIDKDLPALPQEPLEKPSSSKGLEIYTNNGPLHSASASFNNQPAGRFAQLQEEPAYDYHYTHQNSAYKPAVSRPLHSHRRSQSQIIDFSVEDLDELPRSRERASASYPNSQIEKSAQVARKSTEDSDQASNREITPESQYSSYDEEAQEEDVSYEDSIQESCDLENDEDDVQSIGVESIQSDESIISAEDVDPNQLLDLGRLIISSRSNVDLSKSLPKQKSSRASSPLAEQTTFEPQPKEINTAQLNIRTKPQHQTRVLPPPPAGTQSVTKAVQPLGSQHQPHIVHLSDNFEPEHIRQISQSRILVNRTKSNKAGYIQRDSPNPSHSSYESEFSEPFSEPFSAASTAQTAETAESVHRNGSIMVDLTNDNFDITIKKDDRNSTIDQYKSTFQEIDGKYRETIVLDDEDNDGLNSDLEGSIVQPLNIRHRRSKSALGNLEFEGSNRAVSSFSFETVASEVQLHYNSGEKDRESSSNGRRSLRTYTDQNKSVIELCDDTMKTTQTVLDELKRQKTILLNKRAEMLVKKKKDEDQLASIRELQANLMKTKGLRPAVVPRPKSYVYGEDSSKVLQHRRNQSSSNYFDYANNQSYNFETFMRSQSSGTLI